MSLFEMFRTESSSFKLDLNNFPNNRRMEVQEIDDIDNPIVHSITDLPDEMLVHIFSFLPISDLLNACCICKHWLKIIDHMSQFKSVCIKIDGDWNEIVQYPAQFTRDFTHFKFSWFSNYAYLTRILSTKADKILALDFECCFKDYEGPKVNFPALESLKVFESISMWKLIGSLPRLKCLDLKSANDKELSMIGDTPQLESFTIAGKLCHTGAAARFYKKTDDYKNYPLGCILSLHAFKTFLCLRANCLKMIDLSGLGHLLNSGEPLFDVEPLFDIEHLRLSSLRAGSLMFYRDICQSQPTIRKLHWKPPNRFIDERNIILDICQHLTNLEVLDIEWNDQNLLQNHWLCLSQCGENYLLDALADHDAASSQFALTHFYVALRECDVAAVRKYLLRLAANLKFLSIVECPAGSDPHAIQDDYHRTRKLYFS